uniref:BolA-like protein 2 n=1 Tax=Cyprinus carpio carpio TaxID=630221 RepID=A0A9J8A0H3_CYPCA
MKCSADISPWSPATCSLGSSSVSPSVVLTYTALWVHSEANIYPTLELRDVEDTSPNRCAASFKVLVVSPQFEGKPLLQRHRMVNNCLAEELKEIHAFEQKTLTPEQWEKQKAQ